MNKCISMAIAVLVGCTSLVLAEGQRAFVLGNADYAVLPDLENTLFDAAAYRDALSGLGYAVSYHENLDLDGMAGSVDAFVASIEPGDRVVIVYSGHGWSDSTQNYLIPTDAPATGSDVKLKGASYPLRNGQDGLLDQLEQSGAQLTVAIIDACRNNPFTAPKGRKSVGLTRGLVPIDAPPGTFLIYSAGEGQEALDRLPDDGRDQRLSVFSRSFVPLLASGMPLEDAISDAQVMTASLAKTNDGHVQTPAYYDQALGKTCLVTGCEGVVPVAAPPSNATPLVEPAVEPMAEPALTTNQPEPGTLSDAFLVDPSGGGDFTTIADAINSAPADMTIEIMPGTYREALTVTSRVYLIGQGSPGDVVVQADAASVIEWTAEGGRIKNLTLRQTGTDYPALFFKGNGWAEVTGNVLTSASFATLVVAGTSDPIVIENRIVDGNGVGLYVGDNATGTYQGNTISGNGTGGVLTKDGGNPAVIANIITANAYGGIVIAKGGQGTFTDNDLTGNDDGAFTLMDGAGEIVRSNNAGDPASDAKKD
jgi:parallel beta-helix repeat protein